MHAMRLLRTGGGQHSLLATCCWIPHVDDWHVLTALTRQQQGPWLLLLEGSAVLHMSAWGFWRVGCAAGVPVLRQLQGTITCEQAHQEGRSQARPVDVARLRMALPR